MTTEEEKENAEEASYRTRAIDLHANDECEFDDNCPVSIGEDGAWVQAWLWIPEEQPNVSDTE